MKKIKNKRHATTIVETAVVLPLLLLLTFGALKYGWLFFRWQQVTNVTRQAARYAIRSSVNDAMVLARIQTLMTNAGLDGKYDTPQVNSSATTGNPVTVSINVPVDGVDILKFNGPWIRLPAPENLGATVTMSKEGP